jgi:hypothetical protein
MTAAAIRILLVTVVTSVFSVGCANSTRTTRYPDNHRALRSETLVVEQKVKAIDTTKPGAYGPFEPFLILVFQIFDHRH